MNRKMAMELLDKVGAVGEPIEIRSDIVRLQRTLEEHPGLFGTAMPIDSCPVKHTFTDGAYMREITIPKGLLIVGKIHRHAHINFISRGDVSCVTEQNGVERIQGPCTMVSLVGTKRVVYTHEETVWTTVHVTDKTDLEQIEAEVIAKTYNELGMEDPDLEQLAEGEQSCLGPQ